MHKCSKIYSFHKKDNKIVRSIGQVLLVLSWLSCIFFPLRTWAAEITMDWDRIFNGEVLVEPMSNSNNIPGVRAAFAVSAPQSVIWSALIDYDNFPNLFENVEKVQVLEQSETGASVEMWYKVTFLKFFRKTLRYVLYRHYKVPGRKIVWEHTSGDMERIEGGWEIHDTPREGTYLLIYESYVKPGGFVPMTWVQRSAIKRADDMANHVRRWIESR